MHDHQLTVAGALDVVLDDVGPVVDGQADRGQGVLRCGARRAAVGDSSATSGAGRPRRAGRAGRGDDRAARGEQQRRRGAQGVSHGFSREWWTCPAAAGTPRRSSSLHQPAVTCGPTAGWRRRDNSPPGDRFAPWTTSTPRTSAASDARTADLGFARVDLDRAARTGDPEVVYGAGKTPEQVVAILRTLHEQPPRPRRARHPALATRRMDAAPRRSAPTVDAVARAATLGPLPDAARHGRRRQRRHLRRPRRRRGRPHRRASTAPGVEIHDVGVAGLHRLLGVRDRLDEADCLVVVAGMEGALPSVVGGLTGVPLVAVPTSVGYGASFGGLAALLGDAQLLRARRHRGQHRQRLRRRRVRRPGRAGDPRPAGRPR